MEKLARYLEVAPFIRIWVRINQSATIFALLIAFGAFLVAYTKYNNDNLKANEDRISKAWDTVTRMAGKGSNGGQVSAIQILIKNSIVLDQIDLHNTYLAGADLNGASLRGANLSGANLEGTMLNGANLDGANLNGANLKNAALKKASLEYANLNAANLTEVNLQGANFSGANLDKAVLFHTNLGGVFFNGASLVETQLAFSKVDISVLLSSSLINADMTGVTFVMEDDKGHNDWDGYSDSIGENLDSQGADPQRIINTACASPKYNVPQKNLPINLPQKKCSTNLNYDLIKNPTPAHYSQF